MKVSSILVALTLIVFGSGIFGRSGADLRDGDNEGKLIMGFKSMVGVDGAFRGAANPIRGLNGGGAPWRIDSAKGELSADGELEVKVRGLVLVTTGANPAAFFRAVVSCTSVDGSGAPNTVNVPTTNGAEVMIGDPHNGDARIEETVSLPNPCIAPIIFVTSPTLSWFAATGSGVIPASASLADSTR